LFKCRDKIFKGNLPPNGGKLSLSWSRYLAYLR
jgi:hypothetical protein